MDRVPVVVGGAVATVIVDVVVGVRAIVDGNALFGCLRRWWL